MGGLGTGSGFRANLSALAEWRLNMRVLHAASDPDPTARIMGIELALPVMAAPIGGVAFNMGGAVSEEAYITSKLRACQASGTIGCTGDGVPTYIHEAGFAAITALKGHGIPFIKPWEDTELDAKLEKALATGANVVGMDVDAAGLVTLRQMGPSRKPENTGPDQGNHHPHAGPVHIKGHHDRGSGPPGRRCRRGRHRRVQPWRAGCWITHPERPRFCPRSSTPSKAR
jgi:hypothetical protein